MTLIANMFREMNARGVDPEMIALAIETVESASAACRVDSRVDSRVDITDRADAVGERRRIWDRNRKRLQRLNVVSASVDSPVDTAECRVDSRVDTVDNTNSALSYLTSSSIKLEKKEVSKKERAKSRGEKLPPDFHPTAEHYDQGMILGYERDWVDDQFENMRIWARTNEHRAVARKSDWNLTLTGWLRRTANEPTRPSNQVKYGKPRSGIIQAADDLCRKLAEFDGPSRRPDELRGGQGQTVVRLLPHGGRQ